MSLEGELVAAEWSARRRRYVALGVLLASTAAAAFLVLSVVNGLEESIGEEISLALAGDLRVARGRTGLGDGEMVVDMRDVLDGLRFVDPDASFAPRIETQAIFLHGADFTTSGDAPSRAAAVLVGVDPALDPEVVDLEPLLVLGVGRDAFARAWRTPEGDRLVPLIVGASFIEASNVTVFNGTFSWSNVYNVSVGHVENGRLVRERGIVVGAYETGFRMIDRLVVYAPRGDVARLLGETSTDPPANVLLIRTSASGPLATRAQEMGMATIEADAFRESYLGPVFVSVRIAAWSIVTLLVLMTAGWMSYTFAHHVHEDRRKIATLRAVGIPDALIARTYVRLAAAIASAAVAFGLAGAVLFSLAALLVEPWTRLVAPAPSLIEALFLLALSAGAATLAARWAFERAARVPIREALQAP